MNHILLGNDRQAIQPGKIVCIGRNYLKHIEELGNTVPDDMVVFMKPNSAITDTLRMDPVSEIHFEAEICYLIKDGRLSAVGAGLDLTKRDLQTTLKNKGLPWERAKAFNGSALFTEFVELDDPETGLQVCLEINDAKVQFGGIESMIYRPKQILHECQTFLSFDDGDIIMTGTPDGVGPIRAGDRFHLMLLHHGKMLTSHKWQVQDGA